MQRAVLTLGLIGVLVALVATGCSTASTSSGSRSTSVSGKLSVVAAESFWGSIAARLGAGHVDVKSIITNPAVDPHDYEPTSSDGRAFASARYVILNGVGYDPWAARLTAASPVKSRAVLDIGRRLGLKSGDNPHRWYFPDDVHTVVAQIASDYERLDPADTSDYEAARQAFESKGLERYNNLLAAIKTRYRGTPVGASENIAVGITKATGLNLVTPEPFLDAISEGTDPTAADKATVDAQIAARRFKVLIYNSQNSTPDVRRLVDAATRAGIAVVTMTETPPPNTSFEDWQSAQLQRLLDALAAAAAAGR